ncbi:MAG: SET domain-containing protein-lysine N-methyltransferase [Candidatus Acidiferrales bacterium]
MKALGLKSRRINPKAARYRLRVGRSTLHRYGVFALEDVPRGRRVIEYTGKRLSYGDAAKNSPPEDTYIAAMNSVWCIDGRTGGRGAQFINHSCRPNLIWRCVRGRLYLFSLRRIRAGEELTVTYRYAINLKRVPCRCGARRCRGTLRYILS